MDTGAIRTALRENRAMTAMAAAMVVLTAVCAVGLLVDPRTLGGQPLWLKPLKFSISIAIYLATMLWLIPMITGARARLWARRLGVVFAATSAIEMVAIVGQAARGRGSHFDAATAFDSAVYSVMAVSITVFWVATAVLGVIALRERSMPVPTAWAVRIGLAVAVLGMAAAFLMTGPKPEQLAAAQAGAGMPVVGGHAVGVPDGGPGLPLVGWSTTGGDLRAGHFVGLHALQGLPLVAFALAALAGRVAALRSPRTRARLVGVAGAGWAGLTVLLVVQALRGQSVASPDGLTLAALGVLVVAVLGAGAAVLGTARTPGPGDVAVTTDPVPGASPRPRHPAPTP